MDSEKLIQKLENEIIKLELENKQLKSELDAINLEKKWVRNLKQVRISSKSAFFKQVRIFNASPHF